MAWKKYSRKHGKYKGGWPIYIRHKGTGMKFTLFGIKDQIGLMHDLRKKGFERISHWDYYGYKRR